MKFIKEHKFTVFVIILFIVAVIFLYFMYDLFFTNSGKPEYGNRLDGIEEVEITKDDLSKIETELKKNKNVSNVSSNISGRTLNIIITVDDGLGVDDAKKIGQNSYSSLSEKQIKYYAIQVFIKKKDEAKNNFPIIGFKQKEQTSISWTKNRAVTKKDETK